ncbi:uncharacterized protein LOC129578459 [Sitodiplosis mosellana]|uniref:uncharacterized protein LOC129578459 n=1 Tax=Sitodiplosis mosellana TaxID=263140 RepID=UPI00244487CB|nr:uncharacterized protein LOC129578459 [Sitodiplosis mosellana]
MDYLGALSKVLTVYSIFTICVSSLVHSERVRSKSMWSSYPTERCTADTKLKYMSGNALTDDVNCIGPNNTPYPSATIQKIYSHWSSGARKGRMNGQIPTTLDPSVTQSMLMNSYSSANHDIHSIAARNARSLSNPSEKCNATPARLCKTRYNTTAPMYGVSLTSGQPVTIVQKFPDLLQQVVFEVCESSECDVVRGECTQTYVPYLFLVIPLGPVTLTGQDYVLVESGCVCKPKYATELAEAKVTP